MNPRSPLARHQRRRLEQIAALGLCTDVSVAAKLDEIGDPRDRSLLAKARAGETPAPLGLLDVILCHVDDPVAVLNLWARDYNAVVVPREVVATRPALLAAEGCSQRELALRIGVTQAAISCAVRAVRPRGGALTRGPLARIERWLDDREHPPPSEEDPVPEQRDDALDVPPGPYAAQARALLGERPSRSTDRADDIVEAAVGLESQVAELTAERDALVAKLDRAAGELETFRSTLVSVLGGHDAPAWTWSSIVEAVRQLEADRERNLRVWTRLAAIVPAKDLDDGLAKIRELRDEGARRDAAWIALTREITGGDPTDENDAIAEVRALRGDRMTLESLREALAHLVDPQGQSRGDGDLVELVRRLVERQPLLSAIPGVQGGALCVHGTRIPVGQLHAMHYAGDSVEHLAELYELPIETVREAIRCVEVFTDGEDDGLRDELAKLLGVDGVLDDDILAAVQELVGHRDTKPAGPPAGAAPLLRFMFRDVAFDHQKAILRALADMLGVDLS